MKFNRIAGYLSQPDLSRQLIVCRAMMLLGREKEAQRRLIDLFEHAKPNIAGSTKSAERRRNRILGDAAEWLADIYAEESQTDRGMALFQRILEIKPGWSALYRGLCRLEFPGDDHIRLLKALHAQIQPKFYVEIGVSKGHSLAVVTPSTDAVGVDPKPQIKRRLSAKSSIYSETSDAFFAAYEQRSQFANRKIDMAFIDGLHLFEQALRDFVNVEKRAAATGLIAIHDCIPFDDVNSGRDDNVEYWVGDVWKVLAVLMDHRGDLDIKIIGAPPSGLVLVSGLNPQSQVLEEQFDSLVKEYWPLRFADWQSNYAKRIQIIPSHAAEVARMFARAG